MIKSYGWGDMYVGYEDYTPNIRSKVRAKAKAKRIARLEVLEELLPLSMDALALASGVVKGTISKYEYLGYFVSHIVQSGKQNGKLRIVTAIDWDEVEDDPRRYITK